MVNESWQYEVKLAEMTLVDVMWACPLMWHRLEKFYLMQISDDAIRVKTLMIM